VITYDALGRSVGIINVNGKTSTTGYDGLGRTIVLTDALSGVTRYGYDAVGNRVTVTDPLTHTTVYTYDIAGRLIAQADALGNKTRTVYDGLGNRLVVTDANGIATGYGYDTLNRLSVVTESLTTTLGLDALVQNGSFPNVRMETDVLAAKMRLGGDLIYGDTPQIAAGLQWRRASDGDLLAAAGAHATQGWDAYLAASRLWIDGLAGRRTLANLTLRSTSANQLGLLGFADRRSLTLEGSVAVFIDSQWALGAEDRAKPDRLAYALEDDWMDVFVAWLPSRRWHAALAYVDLGSVGGVARQHGYYFSVQASP
jgi:YD repeat-containing protein